MGEWGFAALFKADGREILFDTGAHPDTVLHNAKAFGIDLADVTDVVLSHFHDDHTSGLLALRGELARRNPHAMERAHVGRGFFWLRPRVAGPMISRRAWALPTRPWVDRLSNILRLSSFSPAPGLRMMCLTTGPAGLVR